MWLSQIDPNLFHLDWDRVSEVLVALILLSFLVERFLSVIFESYWFIEKAENRHLKEPIAFAVSLAVCWVWDFDAVSMIILADRTNPFGYIITAGVIAGGSKASIAVFRQWLGIKSTARKALEERRAAGEVPSTGGARGSKTRSKAAGKKTRSAKEG
jgi:hypothetical protein